MENNELSYIWEVEQVTDKTKGTTEIVLKQFSEKLEAGKIVLSSVKFSDTDKLVKPYTFKLIPKDITKPIYSVKIDGDKRLIHFRRIFKRADRHGDHFLKMVYAIGWQQTINGTNVKSITWIDDFDGEVINDEGLL